MLCQLKQIDHLSKGHGEMAITSVEEFFHVYSYPMIESIVFYPYIYDEVAKMRAATLLGEIVHRHQRTKTAELCTHKLKVWEYCCNTSF